MDLTTCNPLEFWPSRADKKIKVKDSQDKGGYYNPTTETVNIPSGNTAYGRTVRMHEAGHAHYTKRTIMSSNLIGQAIEDARIHTILRPQGTAARDEQATALQDLHVSKHKIIPKSLATILSLRSAAILRKYGKSLRREKMLKSMADRVSPTFYEKIEPILDLLEKDDWENAEKILRKELIDVKKREQKREEPRQKQPNHLKSKSPSMPLPSMPGDEDEEDEEDEEDDEQDDKDNDKDNDKNDDKKETKNSSKDKNKENKEEKDTKKKEKPEETGISEDSKDLDLNEDEDEDEETEESEEDDDSEGINKDNPFDDLVSETFKKIKKIEGFAEVSLKEFKGSLSKESSDLLSQEWKEKILKEGDKDLLPKVEIIPLFEADPVRSKVGADFKHSISGRRIDSKKLSLVVAPGDHKIFIKKGRSNGGTILIDASGSMNLDEKELEALLLEAPVATIAFYRAVTDSVRKGQLWIFAYRGKKAKKFPVLPEGYGNVIDFQVLQWLLAQPGPRYFVTDAEFVGPSKTSTSAAHELLKNAKKNNLVTQVWERIEIIYPKLKRISPLAVMREILENPHKADLLKN